MKKIIKRIIVPILVLLLMGSIITITFLWRDNYHLHKKYDGIEEDYIKYADLYDKCEFDLNETMKTLDDLTKEHDALKKK